MEDIKNSRARARISQGWKHGQLTRLGDPFHSREEQLSPWTKEGSDSAFVLEYLSHYNEKYPTPKVIKTKDFKEVLKFSENILLDFSISKSSLSISFKFKAIGFSHKTCFCAFKLKIDHSICCDVGSGIYMASIFLQFNISL